MRLSELSPYQLGESMREEAVYRLIRYLAEGTSNEKRLAASAVGKLSGMYRETCRLAVPFLLANLSDPAPQTRQYSLKALDHFELGESGIAAVKAVAETDGKRYNREQAKALLRKHSGPEKIVERSFKVHPLHYYILLSLARIVDGERGEAFFVRLLKGSSQKRLHL